MKKLYALLAFLAMASPAFADSTINNLGAGAAVQSTDIFPAYQGANPATGVTAAQIKTFSVTSAVRATTTTSEALANSDQGKLVTFSNGSAVAATIAQAGSGGNFASGWAVSLKNLGAGTVTLTPATSTVDGAATVTLTTGQGLDLYSDGTNYFTQPGAARISQLSGLGTGVATAAAAALSAAGGLTTTVGIGTKAMATSAIASGACTSAQTVTVTGTATTDVVLIGFNGDPTGVTGFAPSANGMLTIIAYPSADTVNIKECNNTASSITPGSHTLNVRVLR